MSPDVRWLLGWVVSGVAAVLVLVGGVALAVAFRDSPPAGNVASIVGLALGVAGFGVTIYTLFETQRVSREAQKKIEEAAARAEKAVEAAEKETQRVLHVVRQEILNADRPTLLQLPRGLREAARYRQWDRALFCAEESPRFAHRIALSPGIDQEVGRRMRSWADAIREIHRWIVRYRTNQPEGALRDDHLTAITAAIAELEVIEAESMSRALGSR
jgi:hypothetical protein